MKTKVKRSAMKRKGDLYLKIAEYENLCLAFLKAARGKNSRPDVITFRQNFDHNIAKMRNELIQQKPDIGCYRFFKVFDPKPRSICAASFPERVLHHAIMNICEPVLESYAIYDSYACRKGKGNRLALAKAQKFCKIYDWYLKLDIRKYFDSIDHSAMMEQLSRRFKDKDLLRLFQKLLETYHTQPGKGVPIGNLISQHLANFYLGCFDHWIKECRRVRGYLRYMDDFILFGREKTYLKTELIHVRQFLLDKLALEPKSNMQLNRCRRGIPFLGYRVFPYTIRLAPMSKRRFANKFRAYENRWEKGVWSLDDLVRHIEPLIENTRAADADAFRRHVMERFGVSS